ncbi:MAG: hypothetical protein Q9183_002882 [Haloplaca sp. 2 TL-2023]
MAYYDPIFYRETVALQVSMLILSTTSVALRCLARRKKNAGLKSDDFWAIAALVLFMAYLGFSFWGLFNGGGLNLLTVPPSVAESGLKATYGAGILAILTITAPKLSILFLYRRIFLVDKALRLASTIMLVICAAWCLASVLPLAFKCTPVKKAWQPLIEGHCINMKTYLLAEEIPNCIMDLVLVFLPVGVIKKLQLPTVQKINLCIIFALGSFVSLISAIRIKLTQNQLTPGEWSLV